MRQGVRCGYKAKIDLMSAVRFLIGIAIFNHLLCPKADALYYRKRDLVEPINISGNTKKPSQDMNANNPLSLARRQYMHRPDQPNTVINAGVAKQVKITYPDNYLKTKLMNLLKIKEKLAEETSDKPVSDPEFQ